MTTTSTHTLRTANVDLVYDVHGPLPTQDGRPVLLMTGQPMDAGGFSALAEQFPDRTVVTYDPRGLGRSTTRRDGRIDQTPADQADDLHALIAELGAAPVQQFGSSGGAIAGLALVAAHPQDVSVLVAHEPPLLTVLPDAAAAQRAMGLYLAAYQRGGWGAGMAAFMAVSGWHGEFTDDFFARPLPDPAALGLPTADDGKRDDPLLSDRAASVTAFRPDVPALRAAPTRIVVGVGEESEGTLTARAAHALAGLLGEPATTFPSHHGGFIGGDSGYAGQPEAFGRRLRQVLDQS